MIRYALKCDRGHSFDSWFQSAEAFDGLQARGHVACPHCGSSRVEKCLMAPKVRPARKGTTAPPSPQEQTSPPDTSTTTPDPKLEKAIAELRAKVEAESDYVGDRFAREARAMHLGDAPERSIYGEAKLDEARELIEDGVPVLPLPFRPTRKSN